MSNEQTVPAQAGQVNRRRLIEDALLKREVSRGISEIWDSPLMEENTHDDISEEETNNAIAEFVAEVDERRRIEAYPLDGQAFRGISGVLGDDDLSLAEEKIRADVSAGETKIARPACTYVKQEVHFKLRKDLVDEIDRLAGAAGLSREELVSVALERFLAASASSG